MDRDKELAMFVNYKGGKRLISKNSEIHVTQGLDRRSKIVVTKWEMMSLPQY